MIPTTDAKEFEQIFVEIPFLNVNAMWKYYYYYYYCVTRRDDGILLLLSLWYCYKRNILIWLIEKPYFKQSRGSFHEL